MNFTREIHLYITVAAIFILMAVDIWMHIENYTVEEYFTIIRRLELCGHLALGVCLALAVIYKADTRISTLLLIIGMLLFSILYFTDYIFLMDSDDIVVAVISLLIYLVSVLSTGCIVGYAMGYQHNITRLILIYVAILGFMLVPWAIERYINHDLEAAEGTMLLWLPCILIYLLFVIYLARGDIKDMSVNGQLKLRLARVESLLIVDSRSYMDRAEMDRMLGLTDEGWEHFADGPVEKQCSASITSPIGRKFEITVRKWRGEDFCRAVMNTKPSKGYVGFHFDIVEHRDYEIDGKGITRIYGHDGVFVDIYTENPIIKKDNAVARGLDKVHRQY